jgi:hypothetical protein
MQIRSFFAALSAGRVVILAAILSLAAPMALATPQLRNATGLWINPNESGWGLNLFHQGDTLFGALFVYGTDGRPRWYVASSLVSSDDGPLDDRPVSYFGAIYEATGPGFAGPFDPSTVTRRQAGNMKVDMAGSNAILEYTIDGVTVVKQIQPFTFRNTELSGRYVGYLYQPASSAGPEVRNAVTMTIQDDGSTLRMTEASDTLGTSCSYDGTRGQNGQISTATGTFTNCGARGTGPFSIAADMTPDGLTGALTGGGLSAPWGRIALSRRNAGLHDGNGWRTDLWFPPNESGWGVNVVEQGDTLFATLFVYDAQRQSHWYVASALARSAARADGTYVFSGPLYESTGPYFGTNPFNPAAVTRRQVGTMTFDVRDRNTASLIYTVDGVSVTKTVNRFALRKNSLSGSYLGHIVASEDDPGGARQQAMTITIDDGDAGFSMQTRVETDFLPSPGATCTYTAPPASQFGEQRFVSGSYSCGNGESGSFSIDNAFATFHGFTATFRGAFVTRGHIQGVRLVTVPAAPVVPMFSFVSDNAVAAPNGEAQVFIQRTGSASGTFDVNYAFQGSGCSGSGNGAPIRFADGDMTAKPISVRMGASGECNLFLIPPAAPATLVAPFGVAVTVVPQVAGCAVPSNVTANNLGGTGNPLLQRQASGRTLFMPLPATSPGRSSGTISFSESAGGAFTPQPVTLEVSISRCPGIIDANTNGNFCNLRSTNGNFNAITFLSRAYQTINAGNAAQNGYCWAGDGGQYYINARWTYSNCAGGVAICGFAIQYNDGPF